MPGSKDERGAVSLFVAIIIGTVLLSMAGLAVDLGFGFVAKASASQGADAGALAGAQDLPSVSVNATYNCSSPPSSPPAAKDAVVTACQNSRGAIVTVTTPYNGDSHLINVKVCKTQGTFFGQIIGIDTLTSCSDATAGTGQDLPCKIFLPPHHAAPQSITATPASFTVMSGQPVNCPWKSSRDGSAPHRTNRSTSGSSTRMRTV